MISSENPVFSLDDKLESATPMSAGNPGFLENDYELPPDYTSLAAKEKEAEVSHCLLLHSNI